VIFHITSAATWNTAQASGAYAADSLATEGFIHCSEANQYCWVANQRFRGRQACLVSPARPFCGNPSAGEI